MNLTEFLFITPLAYIASSTVAIIAAVSTLVGTGISAYSSMQAADAAEASSKYNAGLQKQQAINETNVAAENARRKEREKARFIGKQRADLAKSGLSMEGTPLAVLGETITTLDRDVADLSYEASQRSRALAIGATQTYTEGANAAASLRTQAVGQGIQGVARAASGYASSGGYLGTAPPKTEH
jgi:hypothetical protein